MGPLVPGEYLVRATAEGFHQVEQPVAIKPGETPLELVMSRGNIISGRVLDEYGRPLPGVSVAVEPIGESVLADAEGRFSIMVPTPGLYALEAHHSEWGGARVQASAPTSGLEVR